ncbi:MAG: zinc-ribbon domain-containing protein [Lachnospiraceae bacterium]|nr:zinc-ribbon domain-containing protein [Lachnospiraceae bacterium]
MYCPKCGKENDNDNKFCDKCGANLQEEQAVQKEEKTIPQKQSKLKLVIPIVLVVCVGLAVLLFGSDKYVKAVQEGHFLDYPEATVGEVVDNLMPNAEWESKERSEKEKTVVVRGDSEKRSYRIEFVVDKEATNWKLNGIVKDSQLCSPWQETLELEKWYVAYGKANPDINFQSDAAAEFLNLTLEELYEIFDNDYESLGYFYGSLLIEFADDNCPYIFCMEPYDYAYEYLMYDSPVQGVLIGDSDVLINEEVSVGMTYADLLVNVERGTVGNLEWNDMDEVWCASVYYDGYNVRFEFVEEISPSHLAFVTITG